jgi:hypothetical protein
MATYSSEQEKSQALVDPLLVWALVMLILTWIIFGPFKVNVSVRSAANDLSSNPVASFSADKQYWEVHCSHGWGDDSTCENIVARTQACYISLAELSSSYCIQYDTYLKGLQYNRLATIY